MTDTYRPATPLDRARALARTYRAVLAEYDHNRAHMLDQAAAAAGEQWITDLTTGPTVCTTQEAALLLAVTDARIRQLIACGDLPTAAKDKSGHLIYLEDVWNYQTTRNPTAPPATDTGDHGDDIGY